METPIAFHALIVTIKLTNAAISFGWNRAAISSYAARGTWWSGRPSNPPCGTR
ncbi:MAG TPA: hypothetical protein VFX16_10565 [Pseudonocardiaceae bacterium]|nr:hypothetical protein [Pseudonocardiaceae bacterium]